MKFYIIFSFMAVALIIFAGKSGYNNGYYDGMKDICDKELIIDDKGNKYCDDIKRYEKEDYVDFNYNLDLGDFK